MEQGQSAWPCFVGELILPPSPAIAPYAVDWGRMIKAQPAAVLRPANKGMSLYRFHVLLEICIALTCPEDIVSAVKHARTINMKIAARGRGHSIEGQCLCPDGLVIDMRTLNKVIRTTETEIEIEGGASFIDILEVTLPLDLYPTICLEGTLDISIGGLLSVGGVSIALATRGLLIDIVRSLDVITGTGDCVHCSPTENPDLFRSALGGLGQFGIIVGATLPLGPLPQREVSVSLYYDAICAFMGDAARFAREHESRCNGLLAGMYATNVGTIYTLQLRVFPKETETTIAVRNKVLDGLQKDMRDLRSQKIRNFATDIRREQLIQATRRETPRIEEPPKQLWLALVMPFNDATQAMLGNWIGAHSLCMFESLSVEVLLRERYARQSDSLPQPGGTEEQLIFLYFTAVVNDPRYEEAVRKAYKDLWDAALSLGAVVYPFSTLERTAERWASQQGQKRAALEARKERYDPGHLFAPAQGVFCDKTEKKVRFEINSFFDLTIRRRTVLRGHK